MAGFVPPQRNFRHDLLPRVVTIAGVRDFIHDYAQETFPRSLAAAKGGQKMYLAGFPHRLQNPRGSHLAVD